MFYSNTIPLKLFAIALTRNCKTHYDSILSFFKNKNIHTHKTNSAQTVYFEKLLELITRHTIISFFHPHERSRASPPFSLRFKNNVSRRVNHALNRSVATHAALFPLIARSHIHTHTCPIIIPPPLCARVLKSPLYKYAP